MKKKPDPRIGNKCALKLRDASDRQQAFKAYIFHLSSGYPKEAYHYANKNDVSIGWKTMEKYIRENPNEFPPIFIEEAMAKRYKYWFDVGKKMSPNSFLAWKTIMGNMFKDLGWNNDDNKQVQFTPEQEETIKALFDQLAQRQVEKKKKD